MLCFDKAILSHLRGVYQMQKKKSNISFDAMVRFFMQTYEIPTKTDIDRLIERIERLERLLTAATQTQRTHKPVKGMRFQATLSATDEVFEIVKSTKDGASIQDIQNRTSFDEKKVRNAIFRLNKMGRIERKQRGIYVVVDA